MAHPVVFFQVQGEEAKPLQAFYKKVFDWKIRAQRGVGMAMVDAEDGGIAGGIGASGDGIASIAIYVEVDDLAKHLAKIEKAGGRTNLPPTELPGDMGSIAGFIDPAGNWVGLWQHVKKKATPKAKTTKSAPAPEKATGPAKADARARAKKAR